MIDSGYTKILCSDGLVISIGGRQRDFLAEAGIIDNVTVSVDNVTVSSLPTIVWRAPEHTIHEINAIVMSERSLHDCDLCLFEHATLKQECKVFELLVGQNAGGQLGGPYRPILLCAGCARLVRARRETHLLDHLLDSYVERAREAGVLRPGVSKRMARDAITPSLRDVVSGVIHNAVGEPEEL